MDPQYEIVTLVDDHNQVVGSATRREMRSLRLPHRSTYILVFNSRGDLFVQKRTATKDVYPSCYDPTAGGVILIDESYEEGARRELREELGIQDVPLTKLFEFYYVNPEVRVWGAAFSCVCDSALKLQEEEVESGEFLAIQDILSRQETHPFTPDGMYVLERFLIGRDA